MSRQDSSMKSIKLNKLLVEKYLLKQMILEAQGKEMLLEDRLDFLRKSYIPKIDAKIENDSLHIPMQLNTVLFTSKNHLDLAEKVFNWIVSLDPDTNKKNTQWLLNLVTRKTNPIALEDLQNVTPTLAKFMKMKASRQLAPDKTEINSFKNVIELENAINQQKIQQYQADTSEKNQALAQSDVLLNNSKYLMLVPKTKFAAMYWGRNANWCTGWGDPKGMYPDREHNYFESYNSRGKLYIIIEKNKPQTISSSTITRSAPDTYWQFHFEDQDFENASGTRINIHSFFNEHPEIKTYFEKLDGEPVATISGYLVFARGRGFVVKAKPGILENPVITVVADDDGKLTSFKSGLTGNITTDDVKRLLENFKIYTDDTHEAIWDDSLYYRNGKWGTIADVGKTLVRVEGLEWKFVYENSRNTAFQPWTRLALVENSNSYIIAHVSEDKELFINSGAGKIFGSEPKAKNPAPYRTLLPKFSRAFLELLLKMDINLISNQSYINTHNLTETDAKILLDKKPKLSNLTTLYLSGGKKVTPLIKEKIIDWCNQYDVPYSKAPYWINDNLIVEKFKNLEELVDEIGNDDAKWVTNVLSGKDNFESYDNTADYHQMRDLLKSLNSDDLPIVGKYLQKTYPDEAEEIESYDPTNVNHVIELFEETGDDNLQRCGDWASDEANRIGAESEMSEALHAALENSEYVIFTDESGNQIEKSPWDTPCLLVIPISEILDFIAEHGEENAGEYLSNGGWKENFDDLKIDVSTPYYGWSGYNEEAAEERFADLIHNELG